MDICNGKVVVSILYHHVKDINEGTIGEIVTPPWNFRTALALANLGKCKTVAIRPTLLNRYVIRVINNVLVILIPYKNWKMGRLDNILKIIDKITNVSSSFLKQDISNIVDILNIIRKKQPDNLIIYTHEYKNIRYFNIYRKYKDEIFIFQQHSRKPFSKNLSSIFKVYNLRRLTKSGYFVLSRYEKEILESLMPNQLVKLRPMGIDTQRIPFVNSNIKYDIRQKMGIPLDKIIISTYVSSPIFMHNNLYDVKGSHFLPYIIKYINSIMRDKIIFFVFNVSNEFKYFLENKFDNVKVFPYLPHEQFMRYLATSDLYFFPAHKDHRYTGITVTVLEAMAMGLPVVSPTLIHLPDLRNINKVGVITRYLETTEDALLFARRLLQAVESIESFDPITSRRISETYYSWESFIKDFQETIKVLLNNN